MAEINNTEYKLLEAIKGFSEYIENNFQENASYYIKNFNEESLDNYKKMPKILNLVAYDSFKRYNKLKENVANMEKQIYNIWYLSQGEVFKDKQTIKTMLEDIEEGNLNQIIRDNIVGKGGASMVSNISPTLTVKVYNNNHEFNRGRNALNLLKEEKLKNDPKFKKHFVIIYGSFENNGPGFLMERMDITLDKYNFNDEGIRKVFIYLLEGLELLHSKGLAHTDIKPENIMKNKEDVFKFIDLDCITKKEDWKGCLTHFYADLHQSRDEMGYSYSLENMLAADLYKLGLSILNVLTPDNIINDFFDEKYRPPSRIILLKPDQVKEYLEFYDRQIAILKNYGYSDELIQVLSSFVLDPPEKRMSIENAIQKLKLL